MPHTPMETGLAGVMPDHLRDLIRKNLADRTDENFDLQVSEFLKFMYLCSTYGSSFIPLSKEVDDVWHECIMQTKPYAEMCDKLPGRRFLHHESVSLEEYVSRHGRARVIRQMLNWLPNYYYHFGVFAENAAALWTIVTFLRTEMHMSLDAVNELARTEAQRKFPLAS